MGQSLASAAAIIRDMGPGMAFEATETRPVPPRAMTGRASASSPARTEKVDGAWVRSSVIWPMTPLDSLMAMMLGISARRRTVWEGGWSRCGRGCCTGGWEGRGFGDRAEVLELAFLVGAVVVGVGGEDAGEVRNLGDAFRVRYGLRGGVVGAAGEDRGAAGGDFDGDLDDAVGLGFGEGGGFAGRAAGNEERDALGELGFDEGTE